MTPLPPLETSGRFLPDISNKSSHHYSSEKANSSRSASSHHHTFHHQRLTEEPVIHVNKDSKHNFTGGRTPLEHERRVTGERLRLSYSSRQNSYQGMVLSGDSDRKPFDRKAIARRQLVGGLSANGCGQHGVRRSQSFQHHRLLRDSDAVYFRPFYNFENSMSPSRISDSSHMRSSSHDHRGSFSKFSYPDKTREAIENWNYLMHELYMSDLVNEPPESQKHLAVLSDNLSDQSDKTLVENTSRAKSSKKVKRKPKQREPPASLPLTQVEFPVGLGYTRYRPITPNLLHSLDKQKLPSKRQTQMWLDQIQETRRPSTIFTIPKEQESLDASETAMAIDKNKSPKQKATHQTSFVGEGAFSSASISSIQKRPSHFI